MIGIARRKYDGEQLYINKSLNSALKQIIKVLPYYYDCNTILELFTELYPYEWQMLNQRYKHYLAKDKFLVKYGKKDRYQPQPPEKYILNLSIIKNCLIDSNIYKHKQIYNEEVQKDNLSILKGERANSIKKREGQINRAKELMQNVEPLYIDACIVAYHKKGITIEEKIEIFKELQKYYCDRSIEFFYKLNDSERNDQIRNMAFMHLQKLGIYVKLRNRFKGIKKKYMTERNAFNMTPADLIKKIDSNNIQNNKIFDMFISHSSQDVAVVIKIIKGLNKHNFNNYCDWTSDSDFLKRELVSDYTKVVLQKRLEQSRALLFIRTTNSIQSEWVNFEIDYFKSLKKPLYCLNLFDDEIIKEFNILEFDEEFETVELAAFT